ncbi:MAG: cobalamin-binding protein [Gammaproteobacteria bacterium]|nr:cobalamin-binding protein [Gammaproteobacteria bacterium]
MRTLFSIITFAFSLNAFAQSFTLTDDDGYSVSFSSPAKRIISLAPHATELLFAAGASVQVVATVSYSDFPEQAKTIPRIGSYKKIDMESVVKINPDLIIAWNSGGVEQQIADLKRLGFKVYLSEPTSFEDVATNIINMGKILGTTETAQAAAGVYLQELGRLKKKYNNLKPVDVFYQVWNIPLRTINNGHLISSVIKFCGGHNVFGELSMRAPKVGIESVIEKNPQAIIIGMSEDRKDWVDPWFQWKSIDAVKNNHIYSVNADLIVRQGPRVLQGAKRVCEVLEKVRSDSLVDRNKK